jgi:hypothetical protein
MAALVFWQLVMIVKRKVGIWELMAVVEGYLK